MQKYVAGFLFSEGLGELPKYTWVVLIKKTKGLEHLIGKYNAVGGKVEEGESPHEAMVREFKEETGKEVKFWSRYCTLKTRGGDVDFFRAVLPPHELFECVTKEEEEVSVQLVENLLSNPHDQKYMMTHYINPMMPNLPWLMEMAMSWDLGEHCLRFVVEEQYQ